MYTTSFKPSANRVAFHEGYEKKEIGAWQACDERF